LAQTMPGCGGCWAVCEDEASADMELGLAGAGAVFLDWLAVEADGLAEGEGAAALLG
jgi:hypothetical protein